jgi:hypothetical protein
MVVVGEFRSIDIFVFENAVRRLRRRKEGESWDGIGCL